jgi:hypothetical protein
MDIRCDAMPRVVDARGDTVAAVGSDGRATAAESRQEDDGGEGKQNVSHNITSDGAVESSVLIRPQPDESRTKSPGQLAAIDLAPLVHRNFFDKKNPLWDLPAAEARTAMLEEIGLPNSLSRHDAGSHFFIAKG